MSFYTSLVYYRPSKPPAMTALDLGRFIERIRAAKLLTRRSWQILQVKFGRSIDKDQKGTTWEEQVAPRIAAIHDIKWDLQLDDATSLQELIDSLKSERRIYRAYARLGLPVADVLRPITRVNSRRNKIDFVPDGLSIEVGPIELCSLASQNSALAGWIGVKLSGNGYLFPWTIRELVQRAERSRSIRRITEICRSLWPVVPEPPPKRVIDARRQLGALWPYEDAAKPWDWYWGVQET